MPLADCIGVPSPCAPSTSEKGFIAKGTSAMCDFPSEPLYTRNTFGMAFVQASPARSARGGDGLRRAIDDYGLVHSRRVDLEDFEVVGAVELVVHDPGRLQDAVALAEGMLAVALVDELDPTVQHVEHLEVALVLVQAGGVQVVTAGRLLLDPDDVGAKLPVRRLLDAEVPVLHEAPQAGLVHRVLGQIRAEQLFLSAHR